MVKKSKLNFLLPFQNSEKEGRIIEEQQKKRIIYVRMILETDYYGNVNYNCLE